jgi:D-tagatose-1,6-bisphosphate aldolase subunit GatZ/KbaZ
LTEKAFRSRDLRAAWKRVIAIVVQPGVEFADSTVFAYNSANARQLSEYIEKHGTGVFEAHSTDYQTTAALRQLVRDHFAILKVGPSLTFAFREAIFTLAEIEKEWLASRKGVVRSAVRENLERAMLENPMHWKGHYHGDEAALRFARQYSYSDRSRYYWPRPDVSAAVQRLITNLATYPAPVSLLSQYLPVQCEEVRAGKVKNHPLDLIRSKIMRVLDGYAIACGLMSDKGKSAEAFDVE